jgi:hypothetical protein
VPIIRKALLKLHDFNQNFNDCFRFSIFFSFVEIFSGFLINLYWLGLAGLGYPINVLLDSVCFVLPYILGLNLLAQANKRSQKALKNICHKSFANSPQTKELLMLVSHCKFTIHSYGMFDASFRTFGKVS